MDQETLDVFDGTEPNTTDRQKFYNNLTARLANSIDGLTTTVNYIAVSGGWPASLAPGEWFHVTLFSSIDDRYEVMKVTTITPVALTVERGQEGTSAQSWNLVTTGISARLTGDTLQRMARKDELNSWTSPQEFEQGVYIRGDARAEDEFSLGDVETPVARFRRNGANIDIDATGPLRLNGLIMPSSVGTVNGLYLYVDPETGQVIGRELENLAPGGVAVIELAEMTPGGGETEFDILQAADNEPIEVVEPEELEIYINGLRQRPGVDYTVDGSTLTFAVAPAGGVELWGLYLDTTAVEVSIDMGFA
jgi:hypothetical protein